MPSPPCLPVKEGYRQEGKEGKPKRHLRVSATKQEGSEEDLGPSEAEEEDPSQDPAPVDRGE